MKESDREENVHGAKSARPIAKTPEVVTSTGSEDAVDTEPCMRCKSAYGDPHDPHLKDDWDMCSKCRKWWHETCAALSGVYAKKIFTCDQC